MRGINHAIIDTHRCGCRGDCQRKKATTESHSDTGLAFEEIVAYEVIAKTEMIQESYEEKTADLERQILEQRKHADTLKRQVSRLAKPDNSEYEKLQSEVIQLRAEQNAYQPIDTYDYHKEQLKKIERIEVPKYD